MRSEVRSRSVVAALLAGSFAGCADSTALPPADLAYSQNPAVYVVGQIISPNVPSSGGGRATSYGVSPDLPRGLQLDSGGGVISGTPLETADDSWLVTASNAAGSTTTVLKIRVNPPPAPVFYLQPLDQVASPDTEVTFSAGARGWDPYPLTLRYQWHRSGVAIEGATSSTLTTSVACGDQNSTYSCTITDEFGSATTSREAAVRFEGFTHVARAAVARAFHTATLLPSGSVLVAGGSTLHGTDTTQTAELYDPVAHAWVTTGSLVEPRFKHTATLLSSGKVLVAGGGNRTTLATSEIYDPGTGKWSAAAPLAEPRRCHTATLLPSGKVLVVGGGSVVDSHIAPLSSCEVYDPQAGVWSAASSMSTPRCGHSATLLSSGVVLVIGGMSTSSVAAEIYDPRTDTWSAAESLAVPRLGGTATLLASGSVLVAGGVSSDGFLQSAELYVEEAGASVVTGSLLEARNEQAATLLPDDRVLVAGGRIGLAFLSTLTAEVYDPSSELWSYTGRMHVRRFRHTGTLLPSGDVLVAGGVLGGANTYSEIASSEVWSTHPCQ